MEPTKNIIGLDCGNSSFRVILGRYDGETITTEILDQTPNQMIHVGEYFYWDIIRIFDSFKATLKRVAKDIHIDSIGICTWGVDFGMFDKNGIMLSNPLSYRNQMGSKFISSLTADEKTRLFYKTGILCDKINSVYLLRSLKDIMPEIYSSTDTILMMPDILNYFMTGIRMIEPSEFSTTQLMDTSRKKISCIVCNLFGISPNLFPDIGHHGKVIGNVRRSIMKEIEVDYDIPVVCVPSHDTASAVTAIPAKEENFIFISSGTWSLIGTELKSPIINEDVLKMNLTNEVGAFDTITLLKNSAGMFIIQNIKKEYDSITGKSSTWDELDKLAESYEGPVLLFNINNPRFFNPSNMSKEIWKYLEETGQVRGELSFDAIIRAVYESMACCYATTIANIEKISGHVYDGIYIVGGGSKNVILNRLTAKRTGKKVIACSKESTALGNIATQLCIFDPLMDLKKIRSVISNSITTKVYSEKPEEDGMVAKYGFLK